MPSKYEAGIAAHSACGHLFLVGSERQRAYISKYIHVLNYAILLVMQT